jgi:hypothetical protein
MEAVGIGVILFCPDTGFIGVRPIPSCRKLEKVLGKRVSDDSLLQTYKDGLNQHFKNKFAAGFSYNEVQTYLSSFINDVCFSPIRTALLNDEEDNLEALYVRLFGKDEAKSGVPPKLPSIRTGLLRTLRERRLDILDKIAIPKPIKIPEYPHAVRPEMVFQNERVNLVVSRVIDPNNAAQQAGFGLVTGGLLARHRLDWGATKMVILAHTRSIMTDCDKQFFDPYRDMLKKADVGYYDDESELVEHIIKYAKPLPKELVPYAASQNKMLVGV